LLCDYSSPCPERVARREFARDRQKESRMDGRCTLAEPVDETSN
jgi:hypothetical protein